MRANLLVLGLALALAGPSPVLAKGRHRPDHRPDPAALQMIQDVLANHAADQVEAAEIIEEVRTGEEGSEVERYRKAVEGADDAIVPHLAAHARTLPWEELRPVLLGWIERGRAALVGLSSALLDELAGPESREDVEALHRQFQGERRRRGYTDLPGGGAPEDPVREDFMTRAEFVYRLHMSYQMGDRDP